MGYIKDDTFKSPEFVVHQLHDIVSKNGNLLLNIGPRLVAALSRTKCNKFFSASAPG
jgi:alpha-L-fucosidase